MNDTHNVMRTGCLTKASICMPQWISLYEVSHCTKVGLRNDLESLGDRSKRRLYIYVNQAD